MSLLLFASFQSLSFSRLCWAESYQASSHPKVHHDLLLTHDAPVEADGYTSVLLRAIRAYLLHMYVLAPKRVRYMIVDAPHSREWIYLSSRSANRPSLA